MAVVWVVLAQRGVLSLLCIGASLSCATGGEDSVARSRAALDPVQVTVPASGDNYILSGSPNQNHGSDPTFRLKASGRNRGLVYFTASDISAAIGAGTLVSASLDLTIDNVSNNWGTSGRTIGAHRLTKASTEYRTTWACATDSNIYNSAADCSGTTAWEMWKPSNPSEHPWVEPATATALIQSTSSGTVSLNVTADIVGILAGSVANNGWLIKKEDESAAGDVEFVSRERETIPGPRLVLTVQPPAGGMDAGSDASVSTVTLDIVADSYVRQGAPNSNEGGESILRIQASGRNRAVLRLPESAISGAIVGNFHGATLELTISETFPNWGPDRTIGIHALKQTFSEPTVTWNCANDANISNQNDDCIGADKWWMWNPPTGDQIGWIDGPTDTEVIESEQTGVVRFNVTKDVACYLAGHRSVGASWIVKKEAESQAGHIEFFSRETATPPRLVVSYGAGPGYVVTAQDCAGGLAPPPSDAGLHDAGAMDASLPLPDAGSMDARISDAASFDAASVDAASIDASLPDAGTCYVLAPVDLTCDGTDDDCDGLVDEDYLSLEVTCGQGTCVAIGGTSCVSGSVVESCEPPAECPESIGGPCTQDSDCAALGEGALCMTQAANGLFGGYCTLACAPPPDGGVDDTCPTGSFCEGVCIAQCDVGECALGSHECVDLGLSEPICIPLCHSDAECGADSVCYPPGLCIPRTCSSSDSSCNAFDDDCDGQLDEDVMPEPRVCGPLACHTMGQDMCIGGERTAVCPDAPSCEIDCEDGIDNDGNSLVDCDDPDCALQRVCGAPLPGDICASDSDCTYLGAGALCLTERNYRFPGGYCSTYCDEADPAACAEGATCSSGLCWVDCREDFGCEDPRFSCVYSYGGTPSCTPTCAEGSECISGACDGQRCVCSWNDVTCDGVDDDCDGTLDDDYVAEIASCGSGVCASSAASACNDGVEAPAHCVPGDPIGTDQDCDRVDNDCDGSLDEGFVSTPLTCGVGACVRTGSTTCQASGVVNVCTPGTPTGDFTCNGVDEDCDGRIDEAYAVQSVNCGYGVCVATGTRSCVNGTVVVACTPGTPASSDATCDGVDDDCDARNDEDYVSVTTTCGVGGCSNTVTSYCDFRGYVGYHGIHINGTCVPGAPKSSINDRVCNGIDEDCDGSSDEHFLELSADYLTTSCGSGVCATTGTRTCVDGVLGDTCVPATPEGIEVCDGRNNDCDGIIDEGFGPTPTTCGSGACMGTGTVSCVAGAMQDTCVPRCENQCGDGEDDDQDGAIDCADTDCKGVAPCPTEICGNSLDDDGDQLADCADPVCALHAACVVIPDPAVVAPPLSRHEQATLFDSVRFLTEGPDPVQRGVRPGVIAPKRATWLRGKVLDQAGAPLAGVSVAIVGRPELGYTLSRADGQYDLVVNGGGTLVTSYNRTGYIEMFRSTATQWGDSLLLPDVVMIATSAYSTTVDLPSNNDVAAVHGEPVVDELGERQSTILLPPGVEATMTIPNVGSVPLTTVTVRATELTRGGSTASVPGDGEDVRAPYVVELSIDEAGAAGATRVDFSEPLPLYVTNHLQTPVGSFLQSMYFDPVRGCWVAATKGRVIQFVGISSGLAMIDIDGDGIAEETSELDAFGISYSERYWLQRFYQVGTSRIPTKTSLLTGIK